MAVLTPDNASSFGGLKIDRSTKVENGIFMGLYGNGGTGKTTIEAEIVLSEHGTPAILIDVEGGSSSVKHLANKGLEIVHVTTWNEIVDIRKATKSEHKYKAVIWDNLSEITNLYKLKVAPSGAPEIQQWGRILAEMQEFVREQREITEKRNIHTLFSLWEEIAEDKTTQMIRTKVNLFRGFAATFPGMVTQMGRVSVPSDRSEVRLLSFKPSERTDSKFRVAPNNELDVLPREFYLDRNAHFMVDLLATMKEGKPFPNDKYAKPKV